VAGTYGGVTQAVAGVITQADALRGSITVNAGTISTASGLRITSAVNAGTLTTNYGIFVEPQTGGISDYGIRIDAADTQTLWLSGNANNTTAAAGIAFGSSRDTNLYRSAANTLKTDGALSVGDTSASTHKLVVADDNNNNVAQFLGTGTNQCTVVAGTGWSCTSDERTKTNYNWRNDPNGTLQSGFIAQEVQRILPHLVITDSNGYLSLNKEGLIPYLAGAIKEQQKEIKEIKAALGLDNETPQATNTFSTLDVSGLATVGELKVTSAATIGQLTVTGNATFAGNITIHGHILGNVDTRGTITIPAGQTEHKFTFVKPYAAGSEPNVILTPKNTFAPSYRVESTSTDFTVYFISPAPTDIVMNYQVQQ
jgi:hypothetical protein